LIFISINLFKNNLFTDREIIFSELFIAENAGGSNRSSNHSKKNNELDYFIRFHSDSLLYISKIYQ